MVAVWFAVTDGAVNSPAALIVPRVALQVGVTAVFVPSLQVAVAVYVDVAPSFTDAAPLIAMLLSVRVGAETVMAMEGALCSPWVEPESVEFPNQAAA
jgi:hypothetical protein